MNVQKRGIKEEFEERALSDNQEESRKTLMDNFHSEKLKESCPLILFHHGERMQQTLKLEHRFLVLNTKILDRKYSDIGDDGR